jgi:hypothetical protein
MDFDPRLVASVTGLILDVEQKLQGILKLFIDSCLKWLHSLMDKHVGALDMLAGLRALAP